MHSDQFGIIKSNHTRLLNSPTVVSLEHFKFLKLYPKEFGSGIKLSVSTSNVFFFISIINHRSNYTEDIHRRMNIKIIAAKTEPNQILIMYNEQA